MPATKHALFVGFAAVASFCLSETTPTAQSQRAEEINVRGAFLTTRPSEGGARKPGANRSNPNRTQSRPRTTLPRQRPASTTTDAAPSQSPTQVTNQMPRPTLTADTNKTAASPPASASPVAIGLGYSLYMRDPVGDPVRVDPSSEFRQGDGIRLVLEPNIDGFLYVFHTENDGQPQMLFPDARLEGGANAIRAHVPHEVPSSRGQLRWFDFDDKSAVERLYIFVSREPISGIPPAAELATLCQASQQCAWRPQAEMWSQLKAAADTQVQVSKSKTYGQKLSADERQATTRSMGLTAAAPEPSVIRMNVLSTAGLLVTTVTLTHK